MATQSRAPVQLVITELLGIAGEDGDESSMLLSDVVTGGGVINDNGTVTMSLILKDPGVPGIAAAPTAINAVTIDRYRVEYQRTDGHNQQGSDVPYAFDSAVTFTVAESGGSAGFELVRHSAKREAPLQALGGTTRKLSTIARVTFYGHDQAGNEVSASGNIGIDFGDFADPE